jgi:hypothetical protein
MSALKLVATEHKRLREEARKQQEADLEKKQKEKSGSK